MKKLFEQNNGPVVVLSGGLMFREKIKAELSQLGIAAKFCRKEEDLIEEISKISSIAIINLEIPELNIEKLVVDCRERGAHPRLIGFYSHVNVSVAERAVSAGFDVVVSRGKFFGNISEFL